jgi:hypothetical protein
MGKQVAAMAKILLTPGFWMSHVKWLVHFVSNYAFDCCLGGGAFLARLAKVRARY